MRDIGIRAVLNGYVVTAGCQALVFQDRENMLREIGRYLSKPEEVEKEYIKCAVNGFKPDDPRQNPAPGIIPEGLRALASPDNPSPLMPQSYGQSQ